MFVVEDVVVDVVEVVVASLFFRPISRNRQLKPSHEVVVVVVVVVVDVDVDGVVVDVVVVVVIVVEVVKTSVVIGVVLAKP